MNKKEGTSIPVPKLLIDDKWKHFGDIKRMIVSIEGIDSISTTHYLHRESLICIYRR